MTKRHSQTRRLAIFALAFCFALSYFAEALGIADITGAYIAGLVLCNLSAVKYIETKTTVLSYMIFSPIFFASIGLKTTLTGINSSFVLFTVLYLLAALFSKIVGCGLGARFCKYSKAESMQIGFGMVSRGEVALIVANAGISAQLLNPEFFSPVVIVVILTSLITPILLKQGFKQ